MQIQMTIESNWTVTITNNYFQGNQGQVQGGAMYLLFDTSNQQATNQYKSIGVPTMITNCTFVSNLAASGSAMSVYYAKVVFNGCNVSTN